jgi:hypothetical protein
MWRVFGISMSLPGALHTVASQHISTLHNTSGRHILRYRPAQVKHHLGAACFFDRRAPHIAARLHGRDDRDSRDISLHRDAAIVQRRARRARRFIHMRRRCNPHMWFSAAPLERTRHART